MYSSRWPAGGLLASYNTDQKLLRHFKYIKYVLLSYKRMVFTSLYLNISFPFPSIVVPTLATGIIGNLPGLYMTNLLHIAMIIQREDRKFWALSYWSWQL